MATATPWIGLNVKSNATKSVSEIFLKDTEIGADARGFFSIFISASKNSDLKQKNMYEHYPVTGQVQQISDADASKKMNHISSQWEDK